MRTKCFNLKSKTVVVVSLCFAALSSGCALQKSEKHTVTFQVDLSGVRKDLPQKPNVGIRGSLPPLSWEKNLPLSDEEQDGVYTGTVTFAANRADSVLEYKYVYGDVVWELARSGNRRITLTQWQSGGAPEIWNAPALAADTAMKIIPARLLQEDFALMKKAYTQLHGGLYRYADATTINGYFAQLERQLQNDLTLAQAYLAFSKFLAQIQCGHTYCNFWNQPEATKRRLFERVDKLPLTLQWFERRLVIAQNVSAETRLTRGTEIRAINGVASATILDSLMLFVKGDGANDGNRRQQLQLTGFDDFEAFDIYFPLLFPPRSEGYVIDAVDAATQQVFAAVLKPVSRAQRTERLGKSPTLDELWQFKILDEQTAYLRLGTFVVWKMELDWKKFLAEAFAEIEKRKISNLILDVRDNAGGADEVNDELSKYLVRHPITVTGFQRLLRYETVPPELNEHLKTWDDSFRNRQGQVRARGNGFYELKDSENAARQIQPRAEAFKGKVYLLINSANSSATFYLAKLLQENRLATLIGEETGGNLQGTTGGQIFFLTLPNSQIEMDIPLIASYPATAQPDHGIKPDLEVKPTWTDFMNEVDTILETAKQLIAERKNETNKH
ncbi:MAG: S41 family peptidase [candidate division KSB1 bacterium]